eukprot:TRINITY_DN97334_c0_g1_i1.p1 TRINITY_DN97334_c0_g1~~TRINITY_DN97334_c0_g1_i1.p1  ORF type:complete len:354 (+),score=109.70 TRINITY_DN97334_c0_g1_i1:70-1131(+)
MTSRATLKHLQALQAERPLEPRSATLGSTALPPSAKELLADAGVSDGEASGLESKSPEELRDVVRAAEFWISMLEGEHSELHDEMQKHKQRHQLTLRQSEAKASALREMEAERKRLNSELKWLQQSRDQAICERHLLREDSVKLTSRSKEDADSLASRAGAVEAELKRERDEKAELERQLVRTKVRLAETLQSKDTMEAILEYYEDQLKLLNPSFEPQDRDTLGNWLRPQRNSCDNSEVESQTSGTTAADQQAVIDSEKHKGGAKKMLGGLGSKAKKTFMKLGGAGKRKAVKDGASETPDAEPKTPQSTGGQDPKTPRSNPVADADSSASIESPKVPGGGALRAPRRWELRQE